MTSDQVPLFIPHKEGLMFNTKFTHFIIFDFTQDFDLVEGYNNVMRSQCEHNISVAMYNMYKCDSHFQSLYVHHNDIEYPQGKECMA